MSSSKTAPRERHADRGDEEPTESRFNRRADSEGEGPQDDTDLAPMGEGITNEGCASHQGDGAKAVRSPIRRSSDGLAS